MDLVQLFSTLDVFSQKLDLSLENQLFKKFGKSFWFMYLITLFSLFRLLLANYLISGQEIELSTSYTDFGYYLGRSDTRTTMNIINIIWLILILLLLTHYRFDRNQWLLNMNSILKEIITQSLERKINKYSKKLLFFLKFSTLCIIFNAIILVFNIWILKFPSLLDFDKNFFLFIYFSIDITLFAILGSLVICRIVANYVLITKLNILLFNEINKDFIRIMKNGNSHQLNNCLIIYYKICDFVNESNRFLRPIYIIYSSTTISMFTYSLYQIIFSEFDIIYKLVIGFFQINNMIILLLLSHITGNIDNEAKKSLHIIHGSVSYLNDCQIVFKVKILYLLIGSLLMKVFDQTNNIFSDKVIF